MCCGPPAFDTLAGFLVFRCWFVLVKRWSPAVYGIEILQAAQQYKSRLMTRAVSLLTQVVPSQRTASRARLAKHSLCVVGSLSRQSGR